MKIYKTIQSVGSLPILLVFILFSATNSVGQTPSQKSRVDSRVVGANRLAPELYSDKLSLKITLMNLPGAKQAGNSWQVGYKVFFVAEQDFEKVMKQLAKDGRSRDLRPEYFPDKVLLAEGEFSRNKLNTLQERTFLQQEVDFKRKIPVKQQTAFSSILSFYSTKVYDARLQKNIYGSDVFIVPPFDTNSENKSAFSQNTTLYLNFYVSDAGSLYKSNRKSASETTEWNPN